MPENKILVRSTFHPYSRQVHHTLDTRKGRVELEFEDGHTETVKQARAEYYKWAQSFWKDEDERL